MKETLTCSTCNKTWKREISRGRKPTLCPKCFIKEKNSTAPSRKITKNPPVKPPPPPPPVEEPQAVEPISIAQVFRDYYPKPNNYQELIESTKKGSLWHCAKCNKELKCNIALSAIPVHTCPPNTGKIREYERIG